MLHESEYFYLERCIALAQEALEAGDEPFGSVLVDFKGSILQEDRNRIAGGDATMHPEFELARWAANNMSPEARAQATVYTSGEHCPMCAAAHAWVGLGRIVYISSSQQLRQWREEMQLSDPLPVIPIPVQEIAPFVEVVGPIPPYDEQVKALQFARHQSS
ncbi:MAG TPA: nucleoside deaminase [Paenalcaligenes sp.]|nr:nucleoside deaminase [Paenalcaligenes sp.]